MINSKISDHFPGTFVLGDTKNLFLNFHKFQKSGNKTNFLKMKLFFLFAWNTGEYISQLWLMATPKTCFKSRHSDTVSNLVIQAEGGRKAEADWWEEAGKGRGKESEGGGETEGRRGRTKEAAEGEINVLQLLCEEA